MRYRLRYSSSNMTETEEIYALRLYAGCFPCPGIILLARMGASMIERSKGHCGDEERTGKAFFSLKRKAIFYTARKEKERNSLEVWHL